MAAERSNRTGDQRFDALAQANLTRDFCRHLFVWSAPHQAQRLPHPLVGKEIQKCRLFELHRQPLLERPVKDGVAGFVIEIGQQNRVPAGQDGRTVKVKPRDNCGNDESRQRDDCGEAAFIRGPAFGSGQTGASLLLRSELQVSLQLLQVSQQRVGV